MISFLSGRLLRKSPSEVIVDCQGVGYCVEIPLGDFPVLPLQGEKIELWIYTRVREDAISLYGFSSFECRQVFEILLRVNGIGPKVAMAVLSTISLSQLHAIAQARDPKGLEIVPGIGRRTAEKVALELSNMVDRFPDIDMSSNRSGAGLGLETLSAGSDASMQAEVLSALVNLGFKEKLMLPLIAEAIKLSANSDVSEIVKDVLKRVGSEVMTSSRVDVKSSAQQSGQLIQDLF